MYSNSLHLLLNKQTKHTHYIKTILLIKSFPISTKSICLLKYLIEETKRSQGIIAGAFYS